MIMIKDLRTKLQPYQVNFENNEPIYSDGAIQIIDDFLNTLSIPNNSTLYWESNMEYGCYMIAYFKNEQLLMEQFLIGPSL